MSNKNAHKLNSKYAMECAAIPDDVRIELNKMNQEEVVELLSNNTELVENSYHQKVLTVLLVVEDGKLVSKINAPEEEKIDIADKQTQLRIDRFNTKEFIEEFKRSREVALKETKKSIENSGKTPLIIFGKLVILNMSKSDYLICKASAINCLNAMIAITLDKIGLIPFESLIGSLNAGLILYSLSSSSFKLWKRVIDYVIYKFDNF